MRSSMQSTDPNFAGMRHGRLNKPLFLISLRTPFRPKQPTLQDCIKDQPSPATMLPAMATANQSGDALAVHARPHFKNLIVDGFAVNILVPRSKVQQ